MMVPFIVHIAKIRLSEWRLNLFKYPEREYLSDFYRKDMTSFWRSYN